MAQDPPSDDILVDWSSKGIPVKAGRLRLSQIGARGYNLLAGDFPFPLATLSTEVLSANSRWMSRFAALNGVQLAPHGKTTMAPALFRRQMGDGAWAITVATTQQLAVAARSGLRRIIMANQPIGAAADACFAALQEWPDLDLHCLVDSPESLAELKAAAARCPASRPLGVLVELGVPGARAGARTQQRALEIAQAVARSRVVRLSGIEAYEGVLASVEDVEALLSDMIDLAQAADARGLFADAGSVILSAGGSSYFDVVTRALGSITLSRPVIRLLRSGCYLTHDSLGYSEDFARIVREARVPFPPGGLAPALFIWAAVQSVPDADKAILTMGKRDVSHDHLLPQPALWFSKHRHDAPVPMPEGHVVTALNDQHTHMCLPTGSPLGVGDLVAFGISHPCTTFDKWQIMYLVDARWTVTDAIRTYF